jgi:hypothetical protein
MGRQPMTAALALVRLNWKLPEYQKQVQERLQC